MRFARLGVPFFLLLYCFSAWAQQPAPSQQATSTQPAGDPQAVAVIQSAIAALGGTSAIGQPQGWTFQATIEGPIANGSVTYAMGWDGGPVNQIVLPNGNTKRARPAQSLFIPATIGSVLLDESKDSTFLMKYFGTTTINSKPASEVVFSATVTPNFPSQTWWFDVATGVPVRVEFLLPAEVGSRRSFTGTVELADYRSVAGVMHPFLVIMHSGTQPPQIITLHSVVPSTVSPPASFDGASGDLP
jgi:hypothetical protein